MEAPLHRICVPVCAQRASDLPQAIARAAELADIIEVRLDYLDPGEVSALTTDGLTNASRPLILTFRPSEQGGHREISAAERVRFWSSWIGRLLALKSSFVDLEFDLLSDAFRAQSIFRSADWSRVICSSHNFTGICPGVEEIYERMASIPAGVLKIALNAHEITDCIPVFRTLERGRREGRKVIAIAMGAAGIATRILGPSRGGFLTFGALDGASATAPGQLTAAELRDVYHVDRIDGQTKITGLMGQPVGHSISPHLQNAAFAAAEMNAVYIPFEVRNAADFMRRMVHPCSREIEWNLRGLGVTAPHKTALMPHLDWTEPAAQEIGAVNTIVVKGSELHGYNTDAEAFISPLRERFGSLAGVRCAIIGAGGVARSAIWALRRAGASVGLFARNLESATPLAEDYGVSCHQLRDAGFSGFEIVVNATPLGTRGHSENEAPAGSEQLRGVRLVYDLVYNPIETKLMRAGRRAGCGVLGGLGMLIAQAAEQFKLWTGQRPDVRVMRRAARRALGSEQKAEGRDY